MSGDPKGWLTRARAEWAIRRGVSLGELEAMESDTDKARQELAAVIADSLRPYLGKAARSTPEEVFAAVKREMARLDDGWMQHIAVEDAGLVSVDGGRTLQLRALTSYGAKLIAGIQDAVEGGV